MQCLGGPEEVFSSRRTRALEREYRYCEDERKRDGEKTQPEKKRGSTATTTRRKREGKKALAHVDEKGEREKHY